MTPLVSTILPIYNRSWCLAEIFNCLLSINYPNHELIIIDDGSTDDSANLTESFLPALNQHFQRVEFIKSAHAGAPAARNIGLAQSHGEFVQFIDSDDLITSDKLDLQVNLALENDLDLVTSDHILFNENKETIAQITFTANWPEINTLATCLKFKFPTGSILFKTNLLRQVGGFNLKLLKYQNFELILSLSLSAARFGHVAKVLYLKREHSQQRITNTKVPARYIIYILVDLLNEHCRVPSPDASALGLDIMNRVVHAISGDCSFTMISAWRTARKVAFPSESLITRELSVLKLVLNAIWKKLMLKIF